VPRRRHFDFSLKNPPEMRPSHFRRFPLAALFVLASTIAPSRSRAQPPAQPPEEVEASRGTEADARDVDGLLANLTEEESPAGGDLESNLLDIYGFADFTYRHGLIAQDSPWNVFLTRHPSFYVGNVNLYFDKKIASNWRSLVEARLTYLPHGARQIVLSGDPVSRENTRESDYTDFQRDRNVGGVMLEQVWLDYAFDPLLTFRAGQWLSPYGIWVTDHGSPVVIGVSRPFIIGSELIPERQMGLQLRGGGLLGGPFEWSYTLGLSNGRTDIAAFEDLDDNKAVTGRLALHVSALGDLDVGSSAYYGRHTDAQETILFGADGLQTRELVNLKLDELVVAADAKWIVGGLHAQAEWMLYERRFVEEGRPPARTGGLLPDRRKWGAYGLLGYRLPWFPLMPYGKVEYAPENTAELLGIPDRVAIFTGGLNFRPLAQVVVKGEFTHAYLTEADGDTTGLSDHPIRFIDLQVAWAY
jgi:hypothetical protein